MSEQKALSKLLKLNVKKASLVVTLFRLKLLKLVHTHCQDKLHFSYTNLKIYNFPDALKLADVVSVCNKRPRDLDDLLDLLPDETNIALWIMAK